MKSFSYVIQDELGIHARPAGMLAKEAKKYESVSKIKKGEKEVGLSQLMMLMGLGVKKGEEVTITVEGSDEETACEALQNFFKENL